MQCRTVLAPSIDDFINRGFLQEAGVRPAYGEVFVLALCSSRRKNLMEPMGGRFGLSIFFFFFFIVDYVDRV